MSPTPSENRSPHWSGAHSASTACWCAVHSLESSQIILSVRPRRRGSASCGVWTLTQTHTAVTTQSRDCRAQAHMCLNDFHSPCPVLGKVLWRPVRVEKRATCHRTVSWQSSPSHQETTCHVPWGSQSQQGQGRAYQGCMAVCCCLSPVFFYNQATWHPSWAEGGLCPGSMHGTSSSGHKQNDRQ